MSGKHSAPRTYRMLMGLFPRNFREQFGDDMSLLFAERRAEAGASPAALAAVWLRGVRDVFRHAFAERWSAGPADGSPSPLPPRSPQGASIMDLWLRDLRYALRGLRNNPGFTAAAVVTLALGIGANVAIFTAVNSVLLRPLPYAEPDRLVRAWPQNNFNMAMVGRVLDAAPALGSTSGMSGWLFALTGEGDPQQISGLLVSWNHFKMLGARVALGRTFMPEEGLVGQADVVILSHGLWVDAFGADPDIIGRRIRLAAGKYQTRRVIGVMPASYQPFEPWYRLWSPLDVDPTLSVRDDSSWYVNVIIGRLADGATTEQATSQVRALARTLHDEFPRRFEEEDGRVATVVPLQTHKVRDVRGTLWTLLGAVGAVLLIACANVANLLLARGTARSHDLAMRAALGATRGRLVSQLLTEALILGAAGCIAGLAVAAVSLRGLASGAPEQYHQVANASIDPMVMAFTIAVSLAAVLLFGLVPAWRASSEGARHGPAVSARGVTSGRTGSRLALGLVAAEVAISVVLVVGAGLMLRSLWNLYNTDLGFDPAGVLTFRISIPEGRIEAEALPGHYRRIWEAVNAVPGVEKAGGIHLLPLTGSNWNFPYFAEDHPVPEGSVPPDANHRVVTPSYFATLGIPVLRGRAFTEQDIADSEAVGMINERMAADLWPGEDPVGKEISVFGSPFTVVGVVGNIHQHSVRRAAEPEMYRPFDQWAIGGMFAIIRTSGDPLALAPSVQRAIWGVDPDAPLAQIRPMAEVFGASVAGDRFVSLLIAGFGSLALLLGAVGVYSVTSYAMGRRLREFGVRMAMGADRGTVLRQAIGDGIKPALVGVAAGLLAAWWATRLLAELLYEVGTFDAATYVAVPTTLIVVATLACAVPAWRASRLDPVTVLRQE